MVYRRFRKRDEIPDIFSRLEHELALCQWLIVGNMGLTLLILMAVVLL